MTLQGVERHISLISAVGGKGRRPGFESRNARSPSATTRVGEPLRDADFASM